MLTCFSSSQKRISFLPNRLPLSQHFRVHPSSFKLPRLLHASQGIPSSCNDEHKDFFRYTGGRWLWDEEKQLRERYKQFNVQELKRVAARSVMAEVCVSMTKLAEGGFNKVFRLLMNDGKAVIARLPNPKAGPSFRTTASEVATMDLVRYSLTLPSMRGKLFV